MTDRPSQVQSCGLNNSQHPEAKLLIFEKKNTPYNCAIFNFLESFQCLVILMSCQRSQDNLGVFSPTFWSPCLGPLSNVSISVFTCLLSQDSRQHVFQNHQRGCLHYKCSGPMHQVQHQDPLQRHYFVC